MIIQSAFCPTPLGYRFRRVDLGGAHNLKLLARRIGQQIVDTAVLSAKEKRTVKLLA